MIYGRDISFWSGTLDNEAKIIEQNSQWRKIRFDMVLVCAVLLDPFCDLVCFTSGAHCTLMICKFRNKERKERNWNLWHLHVNWWVSKLIYLLIPLNWFWPVWVTLTFIRVPLLWQRVHESRGDIENIIAVWSAAELPTASIIGILNQGKEYGLWRFLSEITFILAYIQKPINQCRSDLTRTTAQLYRLVLILTLTFFQDNR